MDDAKQLKQRETNRLYREKHPNYWRDYNAKRKADKERFGWQSKFGTLPVTSQRRNTNAHEKPIHHSAKAQAEEEYDYDY